MRIPIIGLLLLAGIPTIAAQAPQPGLDTIAQFERYPILTSDVEAHYLSSFDRTGKNNDGFEGRSVRR